jgi:uncharacterized protein
MPKLSMLIKITSVLFAAALVCIGYAYFIEPNRLVVNHYEIKIDGWNPAFDGFRVALISDIHAGSAYIDEEKLRKIVTMTNAENVDAIFLLGDYVSQNRADRSMRMDPEVLANALQGLRARYGVFAVLGNHDEWSNPQAVAEALERVGYKVLNGELAEVDLSNEAKLRILGLPDHTTMGIWRNYSGNARRVTAPTEGKGDLIVLQHSPDVIPAITGELAISNDIKIMFAAHTHGGQVWLPVIGAPVVPSMFGQKFTRGFVRDSGINIFVTSGIGTSILPLRFLVTPEIAVVTLRST